MREIKFRAWVGIGYEYNIMAGKFGVFYVNPDNNGLDRRDIGSLSPFNTKYAKNTIVEQFTGLLDKNGKEIYEGDIVRFNNWMADNPDITTMAPVVWHHEKCAFVPQEYAENHKGGHTIHYWDMIDRVEIIGNIHNNPELLNA